VTEAPRSAVDLPSQRGFSGTPLKKSDGKKQSQSDLRAAMLFLAPNFLGFLTFTLIPVLFSLGAAFTDWNLTRPGHTQWIGLDNFRQLLADPHFWLYLVNTGYLMLGIPVSIACSLGLALLLNRRMRGLVAYRTMLYLPSITSGVALMILWKALYNPDFGPINILLDKMLHVVGLSGHVALPRWLGSMSNLLGLQPEHLHSSWQFFGLGARDAIIIMGIWTVAGGNTMLLYIAALANVPPDLYEAASLDGAGRWQSFRTVTWPQLAPTTFFVVVMSLIGGLQGGFEQARIMTNGGPAGTTTTLSYYIYTKAFEEFQVGYASAVSWILFAMIFAFTLFYWRVGSKDVTE
jgi:multiple sugar transport system permease protein